MSLTLKRYLELRKITASDLSREIEPSKQNISNWIKDDATVEIIPDGIEIKTEKTVYRSPGALAG